MVQRANDFVFEILKGHANNTLGLEKLLVSIGFRKPHASDCMIDSCETFTNRFEIFTKCSTPNEVSIYFKAYDGGVVHATSAHNGHYGREFTIFGKRSDVSQAISELKKKDNAIYTAEEMAEEEKNKIISKASR